VIHLGVGPGGDAVNTSKSHTNGWPSGSGMRKNGRVSPERCSGNSSMKPKGPTSSGVSVGRTSLTCCSMVMTRATIELVPAKQMARLYNPMYIDTATFFRDIRTLVKRNEMSEVFNIWMPAPDGNGFVAQVQAVQYFNPDSPPDNAHLMRGLSMPPEAVPFRDMTYLEYELNVDVLIDIFQANFGWNDLIKPWYDVWLPESTDGVTMCGQGRWKGNASSAV
jgi:hypothetical protein